MFDCVKWRHYVNWINWFTCFVMHNKSKLNVMKKAQHTKANIVKTTFDMRYRLLQ